MKKKYISLIYFISFLFISIIHFLSFNKFGYYVDEIGSMYDAYCIANFGVDRWLNSYPLHFIAYSDGQCAIFVYILAFLFKIFGYSKIVIRTVPLIFSLIGAYYISKIVSLNEKKQEILCLILYTIMPFSTLIFQFGLESHFMVSLSAAFIYYLLKGIKSKRTKPLIISGILIGLTFHTYALSYIVIPIFIFLFGIYLIKKKLINFQQSIGFLIPVLIFGIPLLSIQLINLFDLNEMVICGITLPKFPYYRIGELNFNNFSQKIYYAFIHTNFFDDVPHNSISIFGTIYYISIIFLIIGFVNNIMKKNKSPVIVAMILWIISMYFMAGILKNDSYTNLTRLNGLFLSKLFFISDGIVIFINLFKKKYKKIVCISLIIIYGLLSITFFKHYLFRYDLESKSNLFRETYEDLPEINGEIYLPDNYVYFLWSKKINPYDFNLEKNGYLKYKNYHIGYDELNYDGYYVIYKNDDISIKNLEELGFNKMQIKDYFVYFY